MSSGVGLTTILKCLMAGEQEMGWQPEGWRAGSSACEDQKLFAAKQLGWRESLALFDQESLRGYATTIHKNVLAKMTEWKMRIPPPPDLGSTAVYMISQLKESLKWTKKGKRYHRGVDWPEFKLDKADFFRFGPGERDLVAVIKTDNGDMVYLMPDTGPVLEGMSLLKAIWVTEASMEPELSPKYKGVVVPCVKAKIKAVLTWIIGLSNAGNVIAHAAQEIEFNMNEEGFAVVEETELVSLKCCVDLRELEPFVLSLKGEPIRFWRRRGLNDSANSYPISMFQFTKDHFVDPGNLEEIVN